MEEPTILPARLLVATVTVPCPHCGVVVPHPKTGASTWALSDIRERANLRGAATPTYITPCPACERLVSIRLPRRHPGPAVTGAEGKVSASLLRGSGDPVPLSLVRSDGPFKVVRTDDPDYGLAVVTEHCGQEEVAKICTIDVDPDQALGDALLFAAASELQEALADQVYVFEDLLQTASAALARARGERS